MGVGINYPSDARGQCTAEPDTASSYSSYCKLRFQITDCPSTFATLRADIAIKMNNTGSSLPQMLFYTDDYRLATGASASGEPGH